MQKTAQFIEETKNSAQSPKTAPKTDGRKNNGRHPNSRANLVAPWTPGTIANPTGKNQHDESSEICQAVISGNKVAIYEALVRGILKGNFYGFDVVSNRAYGKLKEKIEHSASDELVKRLMEGRKRANGNG